MNINIKKSDIEETFTKGSGPGGQNRNKRDTAVVIKHIPTGITVRVENGRNQHINRENALLALSTKLEEIKKEEQYNRRREERKEQVGTGMRGDKVRTIQVKNNIVVDHRTGKRTTWKKYSKGDFSDIQ